VTDVLDSIVTAVIARLLDREGGIADVGDGAGLTRYGQTPAWLAQWHLPTPSSAAAAAMNYRTWLERTELDVLCTADDGLPDVVIDFAVHSGDRAAVMSLQRALQRDGARDVVADGVIGPLTMTALAICRRSRIACQVHADRTAAAFALIGNRPDVYIPFATGWGRRLADVLRRVA